ncbi:MAG TPA: SDR family oxidoreductase [Acidimicrobiales bacterium]|jgi:NAD(P)-dependent dehydrogenase (short-subunit alcohol dehydrogenase family)|nr:SDR family oxidoreductase [Acidimicrobiales bacterium]
MDLELKGRTALITGGSRGIGLAVGARFAEAGANVMLVSRKSDDLEAAAAGLVARGADAERVAWRTAHVGRPEDATSSVADTVARFGGLDILVNNAGTNPYFGPMIDIDLVRAQKTFEVNQLSVLVWTAAAVKAGLRGSVINVASVGGLGVEPNIGWYNVTKAAVLHLTRQLSFELAPDVRVNALAPGLVKTKLAAALWEGPGEERIAAHIPLRRIGLPDDIATAALFLASEASSWVTGQTFVVDGGTTAQPSGGVG